MPSKPGTGQNGQGAHNKRLKALERQMRALQSQVSTRHGATLPTWADSALKRYEQDIQIGVMGYYVTFGTIYLLSGVSLLIVGGPFLQSSLIKSIWSSLYVANGMANLLSIAIDKMRFRLIAGVFTAIVAFITLIATTIVAFPIHTTAKAASLVFGIIFWLMLIAVHVSYTISIPGHAAIIQMLRQNKS